jgi:hypothetical protein
MMLGHDVGQCMGVRNAKNPIYHVDNLNFGQLFDTRDRIAVSQERAVADKFRGI